MNKILHVQIIFIDSLAIAYYVLFKITTKKQSLCKSRQAVLTKLYLKRVYTLVHCGIHGASEGFCLPLRRIVMYASTTK